MHDIWKVKISINNWIPLKHLTLISSSFLSGIILLIKRNDSFLTVHNTPRLVSCLILDFLTFQICKLKLTISGIK